MVLIQGMKPALAGIGIGLLGGVLASRALRSMLFGIGENDIVTFIAVPVLLITVVIAACTLPAFRATRIDPTVALRAE
jgi:ABC-type antimicrobial peptide transport system permease subunit